MSASNSDAVTFPTGFLFGASTAAYQIEGSVNAGGRGISIWDTFSHTAGNVYNGDTGDIACDSFHRLDDDLDLLTMLGVSAYRFSVSWTRVQPTGKGPANNDGLDFYRRLVAGLRDRGILPFLTLYHWDLPQPLEDAGGWPLRDTADRFAEFAIMVGEALGDEVESWTTVNEPWCASWLGYGSGHHAPGVRDIGLAAAANHHLLLGHGQATQAIRAVVPAAKVGIALNLTTVRPASDHPDDVAAAWRVDGNRNRLVLDPIFKGSYPQDMLEHYRDRQPGFSVIRDGDLAVIAQPLDFLAINYYNPDAAADEARAAAVRESGNGGGYWFQAGGTDPVWSDLRAVPVNRLDVPRTAMGWDVEPAALVEMLTRVHQEYQQIPMLVTENGAACSDYVAPDGTVRDPDRVRYLDQHLRAILEARTAGVDVTGYFVWSLLDNFEWAFGYSKRFGVVWVDYPSGNRIPKDSYWWYRQTIRAHALAPLTEAIARQRDAWAK